MSGLYLWTAIEPVVGKYMVESPLRFMKEEHRQLTSTQISYHCLLFFCLPAAVQAIEYIAQVKVPSQRSMLSYLEPRSNTQQTTIAKLE